MSETNCYNREFSVGSIRDVPIKVHSSFFLLLLIQIISSIRIFRVVGAYFLMVLILYGPILFITVLFHELGHALMTRKLGGEVKEIVLWPLGGYTICGLTPGAGVIGDLKVGVAGPLMHFPQMFVWFLLYTMFSGGDFETFQPEVYLDVMTSGFVGFMKTLFCMAFYMNVFIFSFNFFIPAYPLDGGRCMAAALVLLGLSLKKTALVTSISALLVAFLLLILGLVSFFVERNPNGLFTVLVAGYVLVAGKGLYDMAAAGREKEHELFSRPCYDEREVTIDEAVQGTHDGDDGEEGAVEMQGNLA